jgi:CelD/BcsL family acetyltransferase involved in cellulose biosynthesis
MNSSASGLQVDLGPLPLPSELEPLWRDLERRAKVSFFTSWSWIGVWLKHLPSTVTPQLLKATDEAGQVVGLGIVVRSVRRHAGLPFCEAWHLHSTGDRQQDVVMIEHNDLLIDESVAHRVRPRLLACWQQRAGRASELHLPGLPGSGWYPQVTKDLLREDQARTSYGVDLAAVRDKDFDYVSLLSSHARRFIRKSLKEYGKLGEVQIEVAQTVEQGLDFLAKLEALHQSRWVALGEPGAFNNPFFQTFHQDLVRQNLPRGEIQLLRVHAGGRDLGYLYSFVRGKHLYVYQSGFDYTVLEKHGRPGLVTHTLAVEYNARQGFDLYDLMVGESRYKTTMATVQETMTWTVLRKPALRFQVEQMVRDWRRKRRSAAAAKHPVPQPSLEPVEAD